MKRLALAVALVLTAFGFAQPASAKRLPYHSVLSQVYPSHNRTWLTIVPLSHGKPSGYYHLAAKPGEKWFQVASRSGPAFVQYWTTPGGSPMVPDTSTMVAANVQGLGTAGLTYDNSGNLLVTLGGGGATINLPYNGTGGEAQKNSSALAVVTGDNGGVTTFSSLTNDGSSAKNLNVNINAQGLATLKVTTSAAASGGYGYSIMDCSVSPCTGGAGSGQVKATAGTIYEIDWVCTSAMTSTTLVELWDNTSATGNKIFTATFLAGGLHAWTVPGGKLSTGLFIDTNAVTTQSGCKFIVWFQ